MGFNASCVCAGVGEGTNQSYNALTCSKRSAKYYSREKEKMQARICKQETWITTLLTTTSGMGQFVPCPLLTDLLEGTVWLLCMCVIPRSTDNGRNGHRLYPARNNGLVICQKWARWKKLNSGRMLQEIGLCFVFFFQFTDGDSIILII